MKLLVGFLLSILLVGGSLAGPAAAADRFPYRTALFARAQAEGKPILIDITASWCPVCKVQNAVITRDLFKPEFAGYVVFDVDFDSQKDVVRQLGATSQSTLIIFKGKRETARLVGGTDPGLIEAMMRRGTD